MYYLQAVFLVWNKATSASRALAVHRAHLSPSCVFHLLKLHSAVRSQSTATYITVNYTQVWIYSTLRTTHSTPAVHIIFLLAKQCMSDGQAAWNLFIQSQRGQPPHRSWQVNLHSERAVCTHALLSMLQEPPKAMWKLYFSFSVDKAESSL